jgi:hypothetical protein
MVSDPNLPQDATARKHGYNLDEASNGILLPSNSKGQRQKESHNLPIHNGSHEPWNKHAENILNSKLDKLINIYCNKWGQTRFSLPLLSHFNGVLPSWHYLKRFLP